MFSFSQDNELQAEQVLATCTHLQDFAAANGLETGCAFGMSADLGADQLSSIEQALRDAIEEAQEAERSKRWPCNIGPYANGICTICGGAQP